MNDLFWITEKRKISDLIPYEFNPRKISDKQSKELKKSIEKFNFVEIPAINKDGTILAGHQRLKMMIAIGRGAEEIDVRVPSRLLTSEEVQEYNIRSNKNIASWDYNILNTNFDKNLLVDWGFENQDFEILSQGEKELKKDILKKLENEFDIQIENRCKYGDLWKLGDHYLLCGDSTDVNNIDKVLNGNDWDTLIFDPPYEIEELYNSAMLPYSDGKKLLTFWDFKRFAIASKSAIDFGWTPQYEFIWDCITSWYTPNRPLQRHKACGYFSKDPLFNFEKAVIYDGKERKAKTVTNTRGDCDYTPLDGAKHISTVEQFPNTQQDSTHAHTKPIQWLSAIFNGIGGQFYLDLFGGGGTTLCICEVLDKKSFTIELSEKSCNGIIARWEKLTNKKADLVI